MPADASRDGIVLRDLALMKAAVGLSAAERQSLERKWI